MKYKLLQSFVFVVSIWYLILFAWFYIDYFTFDFIIHVFSGGGTNVDGIDVSMLEPVKQVLTYWTFPSLLITAIAIILGIFLAFLIEFLSIRKKNNIIKPADEWRGIKVSMGKLPLPAWKPELQKCNTFILNTVRTLNKNNKPKDNLSEQLESRHLQILCEILSYIDSNKDAFVGPGHGVNLLQHTLDVLKRSWTPNCDPLTPIVAAAHDAGKVLAWQRHPENNEWRRVGFHDDYGMLLISSLDSFQALDEEEKSVLKICIGYGHKENKIPILSKGLALRVEKILSIVNQMDRLQTSIEKKEVLDKGLSLDVVIDAFIRAVKDSPFNTSETPNGSESICFRKGQTLYLLEPGFRDIFLSKLPEDIAAGFGSGFRKMGNMSPPTVALINYLKEAHWIIQDGNGMKSECGLWSVQFGKKIFNGVLAVKLPEEILDQLPDETPYDVRFDCPLKTEPGQKLNPLDKPAAKELSLLEKKARALAGTMDITFEVALKQVNSKKDEILKAHQDTEVETKAVEVVTEQNNVKGIISPETNFESSNQNEPPSLVTNQTSPDQKDRDSVHSNVDNNPETTIKNQKIIERKVDTLDEHLPDFVFDMELVRNNAQKNLQADRPDNNDDATPTTHSKRTPSAKKKMSQDASKLRI